MTLRAHLLAGQVIPAHPLALTPARTLDERRQRALTRYYVDSGAGGIAVGVHTTQFAIRAHGMLRDVLVLAADSARDSLHATPREFALVAGVVGTRRQAVDEAELARTCGYHAVLLSLAALGEALDRDLMKHCRAVAEVMPVIGFYLQPAVGGRVLDHHFWREFAEIPNVVAIKIAPFNRYHTLDVVRAVVESGREDIALYTGNDDNIVVDLLTPFRFPAGGRDITRHIVGGLLGQWAVGTRRAVELLSHAREARGGPLDATWLSRAASLTDANGAIFDARHAFAGCVAGIHEVLRRQGLMRGTWCLDPNESLSSGQSREIDRVMRSYPELFDEEFVAANLDRWMA
ncbi:MAG: dihydrodipicolinate synthase family protein [Gemmatimonadaceae bacterium]